MTREIAAKTRTLNLRRWQFNLRGLMFLTFVIALAAATARVSVVLAMAVIPLLAIALARTVYTLSQSPSNGHSQGKSGQLLSTFGRSLLLAVAIIVVSLFTLLAGGVVTALGALRLIGRIAGIAYIVLRTCVLKWWRFTRRASTTAEAIVTRLKLRELCAWLRRHCQTTVVALAERDIRLVRRFLIRDEMIIQHRRISVQPSSQLHSHRPLASSTV